MNSAGASVPAASTNSNTTPSITRCVPRPEISSVGSIRPIVPALRPGPRPMETWPVGPCGRVLPNISAARRDI